MWQNWSLRTRINVLLALVLTLGLAINIGRLVLEAAPRVLAEDQSVIRLTRAFIETIMDEVNDAPDPDARLNRIVGDLGQLRHVSVIRQATPVQPPPPPGVGRAAPAWFIALVHPDKTSVSMPVVVAGRTDTLVITSHPDDEIAEIWDGIVTQLVVGSLVGLALFAITMLVVGRALAPLADLSDAMSRIEAGAYDARVKPGGAPELAALCARLNHLAGALGEAVEEKRRLAERTVSLQDLERKEIARELHDEFGPHLFALRAHASALMRLPEGGAVDVAAMRRHGQAILDQVNAVQQFNRRILERLRPVGLAELGLREALGALVRLWRESRPEVAIETSFTDAVVRSNETAELTIYRVVQEALTNVFRHAEASAVDVTIEPLQQTMAGHRRSYTRVRVRDDGRGLSPGHKLGFGLTGMRERLLALGGTLTVASTGTGVTIEAMVPADAA
ncbi:signal transduction histidine kinase, glucose-6-phosphate specific [Bradyrhizobium oligotrophicum S58]|uniref:Signal transduction histidine kinase, glucose-6-phosphate specific n=1 Tax=Bradyrhizobium oligotrophicum S58 TaxID=1245469 RepID=M4ZPW6_9BRAD|nr:histidine kinase [Bradyrhizobium oligotrophicum]BAM88255.1 signal transduction histidine kinase, glucose-6-phosphate specific [Bradyrhizobium oligotrophicum S58]